MANPGSKKKNLGLTDLDCCQNKSMAPLDEEDKKKSQFNPANSRQEASESPVFGKKISYEYDNQTIDEKEYFRQIFI